MKDLYTFDADASAAIASYKQVQEAYRRIFETIGIPFTVVSPPPPS
jgi:prolyl-tRNA synthetase